MEDWFADMEGMAIPVLNKIQRQHKLNIEEMQYIAIFIGLMYSRNPNFRDDIEQDIKGHLSTIKDMAIEHNKQIQEIIKNAPDEVVESAGGRENVKDYFKSIIKLEVKSEASLQFVQIGLKISEFLMDMHWRFWISDNSKFPLLSSDNPCYVTAKHSEKLGHGAGVGLPDAKLYFPISPRIMLVADKLGNYVDYKPILNKTQISRYNALTIRHAYKESYSPICNKDIIKLHEKNKMYSFTTLTDKIDSFPITGKKGTFQISRRTLVKNLKS